MNETLDGARVDRAEEQLRQRKIRDRSLVLLLTGIVGLMPPVANIANLPLSLGGVPLVLVYVFAVWALLIGGAILLAGSLHKVDEAERLGRSGEDPAP